MRVLTQREAQQIAAKLEGEVERGRKHDLVKIRWRGQLVASYGIRSGSKDTSHDYNPRQIFLKFRDTLDLARCPLGKDEYFEILREKGKLS